MIFAESKRKVSEAAAAEIVAAVRPMFGRPAEDGGDDDEEDWFRYHAAQSARAPKPLLVGVFQNQPASRVASIARRLRLDLIQLHGDEEPEFVRLLPAPCIKAFSVDAGAAPDAAASAEFARARQPGHHAHVLLDAHAGPGGAKGGGGVLFDPGLAARFSASGVPFILAGGLTPATVGAAVAAARPWAVDVSSGVETDGEKDPEKIREFVRAAKAACPRRC
ncbi:MAG: isomerase-domain-containing protein [Olpidium bornovanus]|uniref:N-(5'-phosphoribosyl)anthranilate isomerase n=1 Tax=Olpidium bornovanus TaxID=278681 RepID=A0A8H7ZUF5_9FUNG|nr:MAG: isomerase-domain-containing protein [Olpidium bornovanus]